MSDGAERGFTLVPLNFHYKGGLVTSHAYQALGLVEHVTDQDIITIYDPEQSRGSPALPPLGFNMSGCSGGPAVLHYMRNGIHRMYPVGLIAGGSLAGSDLTALTATRLQDSPVEERDLPPMIKRKRAGR